MRGLLRILIFLAIVLTALSLVRSVMNNLLPPRTARRPKLVKDPVCGLYVDEDVALRAGENYFCSDKCRRQWLRSGGV